MDNWQLSKQGIRWPVSDDHIAGLNVDLTMVKCFFKVYPQLGYGLSLDRRHFHKPLKQAKNSKLLFEAWLNLYIHLIMPDEVFPLMNYLVLW